MALFFLVLALSAIAAASSRVDTCNDTSTVGVHWPQDTASLNSVPNVATPQECSAKCCATLGCGHWVFTTWESIKAGNCDVGSPCCWLKHGPPLYPAAPNPNCTIGVLGASNHSGNSTAIVIVNNTAPAAPPMDPRFVSVGCEMWEWLFDPDALNNAVLRKVVAAMAPLAIRVGGISADQTHFTTAPFPPGLPWPPVPSGTNLLNTSTFDALVDFCRSTGASLVFNLNEMWQRDFHPGVSNKTMEADYYSHPMHKETVATSALIQPLNLSGVEALLRHAAQTGALAPKGPLFAVELGNELTPRTITPATQAADYNEFRKLLDGIFPDGGAPQLFGPAADSCTNMTQFLEISRPARLDAFTFHSYPLGGPGLQAALVDPWALRDTVPGGASCFIDAWRSANVSFPLFMSESNSDASTAANAGQKLFINGFWYVSSLGFSALAGMPMHVRWKLWDPRVSYRPMALNQTFGFLDKALEHAIPELWVAILHTRLIGGGAPFRASSDNDGVLAWAHRGTAAAGGDVVVMLANPLSNKINVTLKLAVEASGTVNTCRMEYILSAGAEGTASPTACLNAPTCDTPLALAPDGTPPELPGKVSTNEKPLVLPPYSYGFVVLGTQCFSS